MQEKIISPLSNTGYSMLKWTTRKVPPANAELLAKLIDSYKEGEYCENLVLDGDFVIYDRSVVPLCIILNC